LDGHRAHVTGHPAALRHVAHELCRMMLAALGV
jgi:hypothetical protein